MNFKKRKICTMLISVSLILALCGCNTSDSTGSSSVATEKSTQKTQSSEVSSTTNSTSTSNSDMFTDKDKEIGYDETTATTISLADNKIQSSDNSVKTDGNTVTISNEGTYILSGKLSNGQVIIDSDENTKIRIILDSVDINCDTSAAIYVKQADKVFVTLAPDSKNTLSNTKEFVAIDNNNIDSVIFSKDDITFNGTGSLEINAKYGHGIVSKDDLVLTGGTYTVTAQNHALSGNDNVKIADGSYTLTAGKDGIHSDNTEDAEKGFVYIENGTFKISGDGDGIDSSSYTQIVNGEINITAGGGSENAEQKQEEMFGHGGFDPQADQITESTTDEEGTSAKGIKASTDLTISGGNISIDSADDALHANGNVAIKGGTISVTTGDDGIHADANTTISDGTININKSYEGVEGQSIDIKGGSTTINSSDDGLNAAGGNDESGFGGGMRADEFAADSNCYIKISGGKLKVSAEGDGVDSNGNLEVNGGETYVEGPTNSGNGAMDYNGEATITGGIFLALGESGMAQNFGSTSTQCSMMVTTSSRDSGEITLKDSTGKTIFSYSPSKTFNSVVLSCPDIKTGETYTLTANDTDTTVEMTDIIYGSSNGMGNPGGGMGGRGGMNRTAGDIPPETNNNI